MKTKEDMKVLVVNIRTEVISYLTNEAWDHLKDDLSSGYARIDGFLPFTEDCLAAMHLVIPETNNKSITGSILESMTAWRVFEPNDYATIHSWKKSTRAWSGPAKRG